MIVSLISSTHTSHKVVHKITIPCVRVCGCVCVCACVCVCVCACVCVCVCVCVWCIALSDLSVGPSVKTWDCVGGLQVLHTLL